MSSYWYVVVVVTVLYIHGVPLPSCGDPVGTKCQTESGALSCTCKNPRGVINLTKIANFNNIPRYIIRVNKVCQISRKHDHRTSVYIRADIGGGGGTWQSMFNEVLLYRCL